MTLPHEGSNCRGTLGNKRLNEYNKGEDGRRMDERTNERLDSSRVESASTPRGVSAPMGSAISDCDTRSSEKRTERRGRERERERQSARGRQSDSKRRGKEEGKKIYATLSRQAKIHVERHAVVDASISHVVSSSLRVLHFFSMLFQETVKLTSLFLPRERFLSLFLLLR